MIIDNVNIYGLNESIVASGLPMLEQYRKYEYNSNVNRLQTEPWYLDECSDKERENLISKHIRRARNLSSCRSGESHDCFLCGIIVQMNVTAPKYWWPEFQRYHFADIVSSTSTMHRLKNFIVKCVELENDNKFDMREELINAHFDSKTHPLVIDNFIKIAQNHIDKADYHDLIKPNLPEGWLQTARITTNYRQLKTIYMQRHNHRLMEWRHFCNWIKSLPYANDFIIPCESTDKNENN